MFPSHALPCRALDLIREYSRPMTRPDWRKSKPIISTYRLYTICRKRKKISIKIFRFLKNIEDTDWYYTCKYIQSYGLNKYYKEFFRQYGVQYNTIANNVCAIEGVMDAIHTFNWLHKIV